MVPRTPVLVGKGGAAHLGPGTTNAGGVDNSNQGSLLTAGDGGSGILLGETNASS